MFTKISIRQYEKKKLFQRYGPQGNVYKEAQKTSSLKMRYLLFNIILQKTKGKLLEDKYPPEMKAS